MIAACLCLPLGPLSAVEVFAQAEAPPAYSLEPAQQASKKARRVTAPVKRKDAAASTPVKPDATGAAPASGASAISAQLREHNAGACAARVDALGAASMPGVDNFRAAAMWNQKGGNAHAVGVMIGQKYPTGNSVPYGATFVFAAPLAKDCDTMSAQVLPSQLPCGELAKLILTHGKLLGDLDGVQLLQDGNGQTMLVPTATNTCVLVDLKAVFAP